MNLIPCINKVYYYYYINVCPCLPVYTIVCPVCGNVWLCVDVQSMPMYARVNQCMTLYVPLLECTSVYARIRQCMTMQPMYKAITRYTYLDHVKPLHDSYTTYLPGDLVLTKM